MGLSHLVINVSRNCHPAVKIPSRISVWAFFILITWFVLSQRPTSVSPESRGAEDKLPAPPSSTDHCPQLFWWSKSTKVCACSRREETPPARQGEKALGLPQFWTHSLALRIIPWRCQFRNKFSVSSLISEGAFGMEVWASLYVE